MKSLKKNTARTSGFDDLISPLSSLRRLRIAICWSPKSFELVLTHLGHHPSAGDFLESFPAKYHPHLATFELCFIRCNNWDVPRAPNVDEKVERGRNFARVSGLAGILFRAVPSNSPYAWHGLDLEFVKSYGRPWEDVLQVIRCGHAFFGHQRLFREMADILRSPPTICLD